ncbi:flagellar basal body rod protein FlgB [Alcaligenes endophyticus]|uniref:Flagellar basal body rod protein FlgB n=1 Tax=Alcaligenes endophyticus TaxID=1929088 RepID=A0ABT8ELD4_9BURK|nr:flagellar basal body rod protein FlgB [Alcaligenes endophyticus]MCX5590548.1 flagellar basal body rod protein FlgB [Alcaligenes endophyticus]MDN4122088.1 flagellar basal body rod protein FlgB [Alcaligenes endophyticus]
MIDRISADLQFYQTALSVRQERQEILASNIANADTPHYKARDLDFSTAMKHALNERKRLADTSLTLTSAQHIPAQAHSPAPTQLLYRVPVQASMDGNTVEMDVERMQFADNTMHYQSSINILSQRIKGLMAALQQ